MKTYQSGCNKVINWNKGNIELENKSTIVAAATSSSAIRGGSYNIIFLDEYAFVPANIAEMFFQALYILQSPLVKKQR